MEKDIPAYYSPGQQLQLLCGNMTVFQQTRVEQRLDSSA